METAQNQYSSANHFETNHSQINDFLDVLNIGVILLDENKHVKHLNDEAKYIVHHCGLLKAIINKPLQLLDSNAQIQFEKLVSQHFKNKKNKRLSNNNFLISRPNSTNKLHLQCRLFDERFHLSCALFIKDISQKNDFSVDILKTIFQLTPSETEVAHSLINGKSLSDIAKQRFRSIDTIRSQLKSIFIKTGTTSQQELILLSYQALMPVA